MILARALSFDSTSDLALGFDRLGLPTAAREYLADKIAHLQVLLTGLELEDGRVLKALAEREGSWADEFPRWVAADARRAGAGIVSGRRDQLERLVAACRERGREALAGAIERLLVNAEAAPPPMTLGAKTLTFGERVHVMGVVNVTPDSFSDGGSFLAAEDAIAHGVALSEAGADLIDVGGESTRPGSSPVSGEEQIARVVPVIRALSQRVQLPISVDTTRADVAVAAIRAGATLVNDITGFTADPLLPKVVADTGVGCCLMHIQGTPRTMQADPHYEDVVAEVIAFLEASLERARAAGIGAQQVMIDPGIGFGKTFDHNLMLLRRARDLRVLGRAILIGTSRKAFLGRLTGRPAPERALATAASVAVVAAWNGADVVRVHDAAEAREALQVASAIGRATGGGDAFGPLKRR